MRPKFVSLEVDLPFTPEQWVAISKVMAPRIFSEASATWFDDANTSNINECLINAFVNEIVLTLLMDETARMGLNAKKVKG